MKTVQRLHQARRADFGDLITYQALPIYASDIGELELSLVEFNRDGERIEVEALTDAVVLFGHAMPNNERMAVRRTRMLGHGCEEPFLIDGCLLQIPEEIRGRVNVLEGDRAAVEMVLPCAERHGVAPSASPGPDVSCSHP